MHASRDAFVQRGWIQAFGNTSSPTEVLNLTEKSLLNYTVYDQAKRRLCTLMDSECLLCFVLSAVCVLLCTRRIINENEMKPKTRLLKLSRCYLGSKNV